MSNCRCRRNEDVIRGLSRFFGETVTIYTTSGGDSGSGFTGVLISINCDFVRLLSDIGPAPGCALGSCCDRDKKHKKCRRDNESDDELGGFSDDRSEEDEFEDRRRFQCDRIRNTGAVVDIPINRIAAFVHNAI